MRNAVFAIVLLYALTLSSTAAACPAFITGDQLKPKPDGARKDLRLFTLEAGTAGTRRWLSQPVQVDAMDKAPFGGSVLRLPSEGQDLATEPLEGPDRIALRVESFGLVRSAKDPAPCRTDRLYELQNPADPARFAYLAACDDPSGATRSTEGGGKGPVALDTKSLKINSGLFDYTYQPNNHLIFNKLTVRDLKSGKLFDGGSDADILLRLDPKLFFTLNLTNDNVQSFVEHTNVGPVGLVERIQFYLRVMLFKIDLKMATTASFFADSANLPMVMDIPLDPVEHLNAGSGMLFNWAPNEARLKPNGARSTTPAADARLIAKGGAGLAAVGLKNCKGGPTCSFLMEGAVGQGEAARPFFIEMAVPKTLVAKGFFPMHVEDVAAFKTAAAWDEPEPQDKGRVAMYFEVSGAPKGQHMMDYWIRLGDGAGSGSCPAPVVVRGPVGAAPTVAH